MVRPARPSTVIFRDYASPMLIGFVLVSLVGTALGAGSAVKDAADQKAEDAYWDVTGPPCPQETREVFLTGDLQPGHGFNFEGVGFADAFGAAECRAYGDRRSSYRKCMFTSPGAVRVRAGGAEAFYRPGIGQPATVSVSAGKITCVLASRVTGPAGARDEAKAQAKGWLTD
jgi:hypothetical protein